MRQRCYQCRRPEALCYCQTVPRVDNRTRVLLLQHVGERSHPFNTARIVRQALRNCELIVDHNRRFASRTLPIGPNAGLLYPDSAAIALTELPADQRPAQLVIVDGTWHQAKSIVRDVPQLGDLPRYRLSPSSPGQYRIRREPNAHSLSTVEATVAALQALEPDTVGLDQLLAAFHQMVESQLASSANHAVGRERKSSRARPRYLPFTLLQHTNNLVVAYGESSPGEREPRVAAPWPVNWLARRLGTGESFSGLLRQPQALSSAALEHMRLTAADFESADTPDEFRRRWSCFLRRGDVLVVYHQKTFQLLRNIGAAQTRCVVLKSIFGKWRSGFHSVEQLMAIEGVTLPTPVADSRAQHRLDMAVALVEHLLSQYADARSA